MKKLYLALAVVGTIVPYAFFVQHIAQEGFDVIGFVEGLFATPPAGGFTSDLLLSSFVFWIMMFADRRLTQAPRPWIFVVLNLVIGLSCALPAYLFARECAKQRAEDSV